MYIYAVFYSCDGLHFETFVSYTVSGVGEVLSLVVDAGDPNLAVPPSPACGGRTVGEWVGGRLVG